MGKPRKKKLSLENRIDAIGERLAELRAFSPEKPYLYEVGARWSEEELVAFEKANEVTLPAEYRAYLARIGDGGAGFLWHDDRCGGLRALRDLEPKARKLLSSPFPLTKAARELPGEEGLLQLGATADHAVSYLVVTGEAAGQVWVDGTVYDGTMKADRAGFLAQQLAWLEARLADEHDAKDPPDPERFRRLSPTERLEYLTIPKNTVLLLRDDLAGPVSETLSPSTSVAYATKHGGGHDDMLEDIIWAAVRQAHSTAPPDTALLRVAAGIHEPILELHPSPWWQAMALCDAALVQALARDWQASLASVARALAIPEDPRQSLREYDWVALAERMPALASGKASELSFHTGAIRTSALGRELWRHLTALRVMLGLPAPARERLLAEAPPILSLHLLLFAFDGDKSWIDDFIDVQRESLALVRDALGSVLGPVRTLTARAAAELDGPTPPRLGNGVNFVAQFFTARGGWNELPEGERDTAAAIGTAVDAARIAAARRDTETAESLLAFAATLGDRA